MTEAMKIKGRGLGWVGGGGAGDWMHFRALVLKGKNNNNNKARCEERLYALGQFTVLSSVWAGENT